MPLSTLQKDQCKLVAEHFNRLGLGNWRYGKWFDDGVLKYGILAKEPDFTSLSTQTSGGTRATAEVMNILLDNKSENKIIASPTFKDPNYPEMVFNKKNLTLEFSPELFEKFAKQCKLEKSQEAINKSVKEKEMEKMSLPQAKEALNHVKLDIQDVNSYEASGAAAPGKAGDDLLAAVKQNNRASDILRKRLADGLKAQATTIPNLQAERAQLEGRVKELSKQFEPKEKEQDSARLPSAKNDAPAKEAKAAHKHKPGFKEVDLDKLDKDSLKELNEIKKSFQEKNKKGHSHKGKEPAEIAVSREGDNNELHFSFSRNDSGKAASEKLQQFFKDQNIDIRVNKVSVPHSITIEKSKGNGHNGAFVSQKNGDSGLAFGSKEAAKEFMDICGLKSDKKKVHHPSEEKGKDNAVYFKELKKGVDKLNGKTQECNFSMPEDKDKTKPKQNLKRDQLQL